MVPDRSTIDSLFLKRFPDADVARRYLEARRWPQGAFCQACGSAERIQTRKLPGYFRCLSCKTDFTVRTGTLLERSHVPLDKWIQALYLRATAPNGISSPQLAREIGVTQKTAWSMLKRLREADGCDGNNDRNGFLQGIGEAES